MHTVMSVHSSAVPREQLAAIIADYLALERARRYRRAFVAGFGLLAALILGLGAAVHERPASWLAAGFCLAAPVWAWAIELRCDLRLAKRLHEVPKVIKSS
jgi:hypothetical protein